MSQEEIQTVWSQCPEHVSLDDVQRLWTEYHGDVSAILTHVWDVQMKPQKEKTKWDEMREICDAYDQALEKVLKAKRGLKS